MTAGGSANKHTLKAVNCSVSTVRESEAAREPRNAATEAVRGTTTNCSDSNPKGVRNRGRIP